ncbi:MAG TPA: glycosyltransferase family 87 protein [Actinomycetota bacterium]|nr:glycosyltransferase family 87 protein [Actinomycetota bacterium]
MNGSHKESTLALPSGPILRVAIVALLSLAAITVVVHLSSTSARNDFTQDYVAARALVHGGEPYAPTQELVHRYMGRRADFYSGVSGQRDPHPPPLILLLAPLSFLPYSAAWITWKILIVAGFAGSLAAIGRRLGFTVRDAALVGAGALVIPSAQQELIYGGTTVVVLVLLTLAWLSLDRERETGPGVLTGVATALKLFPGLLLFWFVRQGRKRAAIALVLVAVVLIGFSLLFFGIHGARAFATSAHDDFLRYRSSPINMSLPSLAFRVAHGAPAEAAAIVIGLAGLLVAIKSRGDLLGPFWSVVPWMILLAPLAWYASLMIPVVFVATVTLSREGRLRVWHLVLFAAASFGTVASAGPQATGAGTVALDLIPTIAVAAIALLDARPLVEKVPT